MHKFKALRIHTIDGAPDVRLEELTLSDIDAGAVVIRTAYAGVGYRDAMAAKGVGKNIRTDRPCVGGVDMSGVVVSSSDSRFKSGDRVLVTNFAFGITTMVRFQSTSACRRSGSCRSRKA
ncbi:MAG: alcohol dehydrogenase catalytic domain-containing protein [Betaproteobacteria bacterium]|nr:alcohol dehydrogenase catalytic domain-containing protein [Betaproteobacteria bacterium]